jgi:hypothetical protein
MLLRQGKNDIRKMISLVKNDIKKEYAYETSKYH